MSDLDDFLTTILARHVQAQDATHNGDPTPFLQLWSQTEAVTLFPAVAPGQHGWEQVRGTMRAVAARFSDGTPLNFELVAAEVSGNPAYTVGYERSSVSVDGGPVEPTFLRVTHIYRREHGAWMLVHRHGEPGPGRNPTVDRFKADATRPTTAPE